MRSHVPVAGERLAQIVLPTNPKLGDSYTGRMLRELADRGEWRQHEFMQRYHVVCNRPGAPCPSCNGGKDETVCKQCCGSGRVRTAGSSFVDNFGRFDNETAVWRANRTNAPKCLACIWRDHYGKKNRNRHLKWSWVEPDFIAAFLTDRKLDGAVAVFERAFTNAELEVDQEHYRVWLDRLRAEGVRRFNAAKK